MKYMFRIHMTHNNTFTGTFNANNDAEATEKAQKILDEHAYDLYNHETYIDISLWKEIPVNDFLIPPRG